MALLSKLLAAQLANQQGQQAGSHPDSDALAAFAENSLTSRDRQALLSHFAVCPDCREVLSLVSLEAPLPTSPSKAAFNWWDLRWPVAAVATCLLVFVVTKQQPPPKPLPPHSTEMQKPRAAAAPVNAPAVMPPTVAKKTRKIPVPVAQARQRAETIYRQPSAAPAETIIAKPEIIPQVEIPEQPDVSSAGTETPAKVELPVVSAGASLPQSSTFGFMGQRPQRQLAAKAFLHSTAKQSLWKVDAAPGALRRSDDGGQTWTTIVVNGQTSIFALSVSGGDIWAGGESGALFHSTDNGVRWQRVVMWDGPAQVTDTILGIQTQSGGLLRVKTPLGNWVSSNAGSSWRKE